MKSKDAAFGLSALAHEGRLAAFRLLVKAGPNGMPAGEIAGRLKTPPFANPAIFIARAMSDTFAGVRAEDVPGFIVGQIVGAQVAWLVSLALLPREKAA